MHLTALAIMRVFLSTQRWKKPNGCLQAKNQALVRQPDDFTDCHSTTEDAKCDESDYLKLQAQSRDGLGEHEYDLPDPVKPEPQTFPLAGISKGSEQGEVKKTSNRIPDAKNPAATKQPSESMGYHPTTEDDPAQYDELGYSKPQPQPQIDEEEHEYNYPDLAKPSVKPNPHTISMTGTSKEFYPSKTDPASVPSEYSYAYGPLWLSACLGWCVQCDINVIPRSPTSDTNSASTRPISDTNVELQARISRQ